MSRKDWEKHKNATKRHICNKSLVKDHFLDSVSVYNYNIGRYMYCSQSHRRCYYKAMKKMNFIGPQREGKERGHLDLWIAIYQKTCLFCTEPLLVQNYKDYTKDPLPCDTN